MTKGNGDVLSIELLRPLEWLELLRGRSGPHHLRDKLQTGQRRV